MLDIINFLNEKIIWGVPALILFLGTGIYLSIKLNFFQFNLPRIIKMTFFSSGKNPDKNSPSETKTLSPFQTLTSALAVTLGTGNIVALGTAIALGGAGAVFWMVVSAFLGMATAYAENYLGIKTRRTKPDGSRFGGAFFYIKEVLGSKWAKFFALCCILASLGMGNMTQINALAVSLERGFGVPLWTSGVMAMVLVGLLVFGGAVFFGQVTEKVIPVLSVVYIIGCFIVIIMNFSELPTAFSRIIQEAFSLRSVGGGVLGSALMRGMSWGFRRGIFSHEAGLGTAVIFNSMSSEESAMKQSLWASLAVFIDTVIICVLTALAILVTGADKLGIEGALFASAAFGTAFGKYADMFLSACIALFAVATASGWSFFGTVCVEYLFGKKFIKLFAVIFTLCCFIGATARLELIWGAADVFNGLMAVPNLLAVLIFAWKYNKIKMQD
ncbi:MAG: amino acid carrier protein [Oscillospiraceae bacterium]|nr:amino acid carrier protein [Oscillospiraceae bacterium]